MDDLEIFLDEGARIDNREWDDEYDEEDDDAVL